MKYQTRPSVFFYILCMGILLASPFRASAGSSISYSPTSPQVYDGSSDITVTCDAQGGGSDNSYWFPFKADGSRLAGSCAMSAADGLCGVSFNTACGTNFQTAAGVAGDVKFVYADYSQVGTPAACYNVGATLTSCLASLGYSSAGSISSTYTLCSGSCGGGSATSTAFLESTSTVDQTEMNLWFSVWTMLSIMWFVVWLYRRN